MISGSDLSEDLQLASLGDRLAASRVYDQTCADAWLLARCVVPEPAAAQGALLAAYREVLGSPTRPVPPLSPRAWVLSRVQAHAIATRDNEGSPSTTRSSGSTSTLGAFRVGCARLLLLASGPTADTRRRL